MPTPTPKTRNVEIRIVDCEMLLNIGAPFFILRYANIALQTRSKKAIANSIPIIIACLEFVI